jgi:uncharacterized membrane protein (UPF0127 family)
MKGLLDSAVCRQGEVLVLVPCSSIHTFGMREPIDVAFVDCRGRVLESVQGLMPNRCLSRRGARCVLERRGGFGGGVWFKPGEYIGLKAGGVGSEEP